MTKKEFGKVLFWNSSNFKDEIRQKMPQKWIFVSRHAIKWYFSIKPTCLLIKKSMCIIFTTCCTPIQLELQIFRFLSIFLTTLHKSSPKKQIGHESTERFLFQSLYMSGITKKLYCQNLGHFFFQSVLFSLVDAIDPNEFGHNSCITNEATKWPKYDPKIGFWFK